MAAWTNEMLDELASSVKEISVAVKQLQVGQAELREGQAMLIQLFVEQREINVALRREMAERDQRYQQEFQDIRRESAEIRKEIADLRRESAETRKEIADLRRDFLQYIRFERENGHGNGGSPTP